MVALPGGTIASAKLWFVALADGIPASSRTDEPSAVIRGSRCSRRTISIHRRLVVDCRQHPGKRKAFFQAFCSHNRDDEECDSGSEEDPR